MQKAYNKALHRNWFTWHLFRVATLAKKPPSKPILRARRYMPKTVSNESWLRGLIRGKLGGVQSLCKASGQGSVGVPVCNL